MKKSVLIVLAILLPLACKTMPPAGRPEAHPEIDALMERWITALKHKDIDVFMSTYWDEAERVIVQPDGKEIRQGFHGIRVDQMDRFAQSDIFRELNYSEPEREIRPNRATYIYNVEGPGFNWIERFELARREGKWRIVHQVIEPLPGEGEAREREAPRVASNFQAWADGNRNGILEPPELREFLEAVRALFLDPHPVVRTPVDEFFDLDRNGQIDHLELGKARNILFREQPRRLYQYDPDLAKLLDANKDGYIGFGDSMELHDALFWIEARRPHDVRSRLDGKIDRNEDGFVDEREIEEFSRRIFMITALLPLSPIEEMKPFVEKGDIFDYADLNGNGSLEPNEQNELNMLFMEALHGLNHPISSPLDEYFNRNRDGRIDEGEIERARVQILEAALRRMFDLEPEFAAQFIDLNRNRHIDDEDVELVFYWLFQGRWWQTEPRRVSGPVEERLDRNRDGRVDEGELHEFHNKLIRIAGLTWLETPEEREERWEVANVLDELADLNRDGFVDPKENRIAMEGLQGPHRVESEFDRRIDFNRNGDVEVFEIMKARRAGGVMEEEKEAPRALQAATLIDGFFDLNSDRRVDEEEIKKIVKFFLSGPERAEVPGRWLELLDLDRNGRVSRDELIESREMYLRPHPVNPDFKLDKKLDKNRDGFVDPGEIGIAAGMSAGQPILSFDERLEQLGWEKERVVEAAGTEQEKRSFESDYYKKLGMIQDRKLAVMGINRGTKNVDEETATGLMVFIENGFVNVGKVRVVDRQNITKIVKEYEFQQSDLTDETTAVEIGKLTGADIIVIGSISYVGKRFYLNIKLISVETAEIIGSSIADAGDATEFYEMCNEAVFKLF